MKLLAVADLHFGLTQFDWVLEQAAAHDAVIIAGDLLDIAGHLDLDAQIVVVTKYLRAIAARVPVFVCSGNHDGDEPNESDEYVARWLQRVRAEGLAVDGVGIQIGPTRVSVCPWWDGPAVRASMQAFLRAERTRASGPWWWVHHAPPDRLGVSWTGKEHRGDAFLGELITELQPTWVFCGHIHHSPFRTGGAWASRQGDTWVFNAGRQSGAPPSFIRIDVDEQRATWVSQAGVEEQDLRLTAPG